MGFSQRIYYHLGAPLYETVLGAFTLGRWWRWQRLALRDLPASGRVLELGCGTGRLLAQRLEVGPAVGMDMAMPMLRRAHRRLGQHGGGAPILAADAGRLPFPDESFDAVISTGVLTAMPDVRSALAEVRRVIRPGGKMAFVETMPPRRVTLRARVALVALRAARDNFHDLSALLAAHGIEAHDEEIGRAGTVHLVTATAP